MKSIKISVVIPVFNEQENIAPLQNELTTVLNKMKISYEIIWVDDCSLDNTRTEILHNKTSRVILLEHEFNKGQSAAMMSGILAAKGEYIITLDGDLQNDPTDIPKLFLKIQQGFDMVCGHRSQRKDVAARTIFSRIANYFARKLTKVPVRDLGCTLRIFRRKSIAQFELLGEMHRVFVVYMHLRGLNIGEIEVNHRARLHGKSKYGYNRILKFVLDLILAIFYSKFQFKPLYYFGSIAFFMFSLGTILEISSLLLRIFLIKNYLDTTLITSGLLFQISSLTFLSFGLIAELLIRGKSEVGRTQK